ANPGRAEALFKKAIAAGDVSWSAYELGDFYLSDTLLRDPVKAADAYRRSADAGNTAALRGLAEIFVKGDTGVPADPSRAEGLFKQAIAGGDVLWSGYELGDLYMANTSLKNAAKAGDAYRLSADAGNAAAMRALAEILVKGDGGVPADPPRA